MKLTGSEPARGMTIAALIAFLGVLVLYLDRPGYSEARLALFVALGGAAVLGTAGAVVQRAVVAGIGAALLALLGFWQATLWVFVLPMAGVLATASVLIALDERTVETQ